MKVSKIIVLIVVLSAACAAQTNLGPVKINNGATINSSDDLAQRNTTNTFTLEQTTKSANNVRNCNSPSYATLQACIDDTPTGGTATITSAITTTTLTTIGKTMKLSCSPGTYINFTGTGEAVYVGSASSNVYGVEIDGCGINGSASSTNLWHFNRAAHGVFTNLSGRNTSGACFYVYDTQTSQFNNPRCSSNEAAFTTVPVNGISCDGTLRSTNLQINNAVVEGVSGFGIVNTGKCNQLVFNGGTSEGNGCGISDAGAGGSNMGNTYNFMDIESNTCNYDIVASGSLSTFNGLLNSGGALASLHVVAGGAQTRLKDSFFGTVLIDGPNQYTEISNSRITTLTDNDTTTSLHDVWDNTNSRYFNDLVSKYEVNVGTEASSWNKFRGASGTLREYGAISAENTWGPTTGAYWREAYNGTLGMPYLWNLPHGGGAMVGTTGGTPAGAFTSNDNGFCVKMANNSAHPNRAICIGYDDANDTAFILGKESTSGVKPLSIYLGTPGTAFKIMNVTGTGNILATSISPALTTPTVGGGATITRLEPLCSGAITPSSVAATTCAEQTFTIAACSTLATTDTVLVNQSTGNTSLAHPVGDWRVSSSGVLAHTYCNTTAGALTPTAQTITIWRFR